MSDNYQATFAAPLTRAELEADNPYVPQFEFLQESDASLGVKVGPGYWNDLPYLANSGIKVYRATLSQTSTDAPIATVLENTLGGTLVWSRVAAGTYRGTLAGAFPDAAKIMVQLTYGAFQSDYETSGVILSWEYGDADTIGIASADVTGLFQDMIANSTSIEISVYP